MNRGRRDATALARQRAGSAGGPQRQPAASFRFELAGTAARFSFWGADVASQHAGLRLKLETMGRPASKKVPTLHRRRSWDVFLSYSTRDVEMATRIAGDLRASGLTVWHDVSNLHGGERIRESIDRAIRASKVFLLLTSRHSLRSRWVLNELDAAMLSEISRRKGFVIPVLIGKVDPANLPADLLGKRYVDLRHNFRARYSSKRGYLLQSIRLLAGQGAPPPGDHIRLVPDFLNAILAHKYDGRRETKEHVRATVRAMATSAIEDSWKLIKPGWRGNAKELLGLNIFDRRKCCRAFRKKYGQFAMEQLAVFCVDHEVISFSGGFTMKQFNSFIQTANILLGMFALRDFLVAEQGLDLAVVEFERKRMAFMATDATG